MSLGTTLRTAREACGLTTSELAARTHMLVQIVEGLEREDFRRIPAPIYGRGFIKLYCEATGLDPKPLQQEFMDLFNKVKDAPLQNEPSTVKSTVVAAPPPSTDEVPPAVTAIETTADESVSQEPAASPAAAESLFDLPVQATPVQQPQNIVQPPPKRSYGELFSHSYATEEKPSGKSAAEKFRATMSNVSSGVFANVQNLPKNTGRIITVTACAILLLALAGWGVAALHKATTPADTKPLSMQSETKAEIDDGAKSPEKAKVVPAKTNKPKTTTKPGELKVSGVEIPSLYID